MVEAREVLQEIEEQEWKNNDRVEQHAPAPGIQAVCVDFVDLCLFRLNHSA